MHLHLRSRNSSPFRNSGLQRSSESFWRLDSHGHSNLGRTGQAAVLYLRPFSGKPLRVTKASPTHSFPEIRSWSVP